MGFGDNRTRIKIKLINYFLLARHGGGIHTDDSGISIIR